MTKEEIMQAVARGWCHEKNSSKTMDVDLAMAIADEIALALDIPVLIKMKTLMFKIKHFFKCTCKLWEQPAFACPECSKKYRCYYSGNDCSCGTINLCNSCAKKHVELGH